MEYIENARKKFPKEKVEFMIGGAAEALKQFSNLNIPGMPSVNDLTDKASELMNVASALKSGSPEQLKSTLENSGLSTDINKIAEAANIAKNIGGSVSGLEDAVKNKLDEAATLASSVSSPEKVEDLAKKAKSFMGALNAVGMLKNAAQQFLGSGFVKPITKPLAGKMVDKQKVWELPSQYKAEYPHNKVTSTPSGHTVQLDDTPGEERIMVADMRGNYVEMGKDGVNIRGNTKMNITVGSASPGGEFSLRIKSKCDIHVDGDANIKVTGNMDGEVEGSSTMLVKGDAGIVVNGDSSSLVKGNAGIQVNGTSKIHSDGNMSIKTEGDMLFESAGNMVVKSAGTMKTESGGTMDITAGGNMAAKAPRIDLN
jgi:hypothetical protein